MVVAAVAPGKHVLVVTVAQAVAPWVWLEQTALRQIMDQVVVVELN